MSELYLLRHGIAGDRGEWRGEDDELRPLTEPGIKAMKREARHLEDLGVAVDVIVTSPLTRALQTAEIVGKSLKVPVHEDRLLKPGFDLALLEQLLAGYPEQERLMIVGHEPDFSHVISQVIGGGAVLLKKGGLARIDLTARRPPRGQLAWLLAPEHLSA